MSESVRRLGCRGKCEACAADVPAAHRATSTSSGRAYLVEVTMLALLLSN